MRTWARSASSSARARGRGCPPPCARRAAPARAGRSGDRGARTARPAPRRRRPARARRPRAAAPARPLAPGAPRSARARACCGPRGRSAASSARSAARAAARRGARARSAPSRWPPRASPRAPRRPRRSRARPAARSRRAPDRCAERGRRLLERAPELAEHGLGDRADHRDRVGREQQRSRGEADAAADQALEDAVGREPVGRRLQGGEQDRRDRRLAHEQLAAVEQQRGGHREHDEHGDLPRAAADQEEQQARDGDAEHDAADQLDRAAAPLPVGHAEADDGGDRGEGGTLARQQQDREPPRAERGGRGLEDRGQVRAQPPAGGGGERAGGSGSEAAHLTYLTTRGRPRLRHEHKPSHARRGFPPGDDAPELAMIVDCAHYRDGRRQQEGPMISGWAAIITVPTFIASFYGMNFDHMPERLRGPRRPAARAAGAARSSPARR